MKICTPPDYKKIYTDMISIKYPDKIDLCKKLLSKDKLSFLDVLKLNKIAFDSQAEEQIKNNQKHKSYDKQTIFEILEFQNKHKLNNIELSRYFNISRNTLASWKKRFILIKVMVLQFHLLFMEFGKVDF